MHPELKQSDSWRYIHELLPAVKALWAGDYEHKGDIQQQQDAKPKSVENVGMRIVRPLSPSVSAAGRPLPQFAGVLRPVLDA